MRGITDRLMVAAMLAVASLAVYGAAPASAAPSDLDPSFGTGGVALNQFSTDTPPVSYGDDVVTGANGDLYVSGGLQSPSGNSEVFVARYTSSGALDPSFGTGGVAIYQLGLGTSKQSGTFASSGLLRMALEPDGRIVVATDCTGLAGHDEVAVVRLTTSGALDTTFGTGGVFRQQLSTASTPDSHAIGLAVQPNGDPVITGQFANSAGNTELFVERLLYASGTPDPAFATGGLYEHQYGLGTTPYSTGSDVLIQPGGDVVISVSASDTSSNAAFGLTRLTATGATDPSFETSFMQLGKASGGSAPYRIRMQSNGDLVLAGAAADASDNYEYAVVRYLPNGALDTSFGPSGTGVFLHQMSEKGNSIAYGLAVQANDRILVGGAAVVGSGADADIVRLTSNGTLDTSFAGTGIASEQFATGGSPFSGATGTAITPDGQLVISGIATTTTSGEFRVFLARMLLDSPPSVSISQSPASAVAGEPVTFTATASDDTSVTGIGWDLGSGHFTDATGTTATKTFSAPGTYTVRAQATDDDGLSTVATRIVQVAPEPPPTVSVKKVKGSGGKVTFSITCAGLSGQVCDVSAQLSTLEHKHGKHVVALSARLTRHRETIGSKSFTLGVGQSKNVTISLKGKGKSLLSQFGHVPATLQIKLGSTTAFDKKLTIKPPKKHKHHSHH